MAPHLTNAKHIVVPGAGHITLTRGCVPAIVEGSCARPASGLDPACTGAPRVPLLPDAHGPAALPATKPGRGAPPASKAP
jgi:hypothetical protein